MTEHGVTETTAAPTVTVPVEKIQSVITDLEDTECSFWACRGPDVPFEDMATCRVCSSVQDLRVLIGLPPTGAKAE